MENIKLKYDKEYILNNKVAIEFDTWEDYISFCDSIKWPSRDRVNRRPHSIQVRFNEPGCNQCNTESNYYAPQGYEIIKYTKEPTYELY